MTLSISSVFICFECYTHIFDNIPFWFSNKVPEAIYYYGFTELFWALLFFSSDTIINDSFVTLSFYFSKLS